MNLQCILNATPDEHTSPSTLTFGMSSMSLCSFVFELSLTMRAPRLTCVLINFNLSGIIAALNQLFRWLFDLLFGSIQTQVANPTSYGSETIDLLYLPVGFFFLSLSALISSSCSCSYNDPNKHLFCCRCFCFFFFYSMLILFLVSKG